MGELEELLAQHPLRERRWGLLMLALYRSGRQSEALRAYRRLQALLASELGIEPSPELQALEERILLQDPKLDAAHPAPSRKTNLRPRLNTFVGRRGEIGEISALLSESRLVTLTGSAGSGKTRLALEMAEGRIAIYPDGVWLVDLAPITSPDQVADAMAKPFGMGGNSDRPIEQVLTDYLRDRQALLVIDNCEHLVSRAAALVRDMLEENPHLHVLATSRERLGVAGEVNYPVPPLPYPQAGDDIEASDSVQLFADRARAANSRFEITVNNRQSVAEVCRKLDGIPLAIELAAARANTFSPHDLATYLDRRLAILTSPGHSVARHQTLRAAIDWSYDILDPVGQTLFRRMSVFRGGFEMEAAIAVCGYGPLDQSLVLTILPQLVDKSLIVVDQPAHGPARYRLLEMLREYGREQLAVPDSNDLRDSHAAYFASFAEAAAIGLRGPEQKGWIRRLSADHDNLRKALRWTDSKSPELTVRIAVALTRFWDAVGPRAEGHEWLRRAVELSDAMSPEMRIKARVAASDVFSSMRVLHSQTYAEEALAEARRVGDMVGEAQAQRALCWAMALAERPDVAVPAGKAALETFERLGDRWEQAYCLERLGQADFRDPVMSITRLEKARGLYAEVGDRTREAVTLYKLAGLHARRENYGRALADAEASLAISRDLGSLHDEAHGLNEYGNVFIRANQPEQALEVLEQALELLTQTGDDRCSVRTLAAMGTALVHLGDEARADRVLRETLNRASDLDEVQSIRVATIAMAQLLHARGQLAQSVQLYSFVDNLGHQGGLPLIPSRREKRESVIGELRSRLSEEEFASSWNEGKSMSAEDVRKLVEGLATSAAAS